VLILETPSPLSLVVAARNFWLDPTHVRPLHPESLRLLYEMAGFAAVERLDLRPFTDAERLPEIDLARLPAEQRTLGDAVNRLRDHLDELLYGCQDFAMIGTKAAGAAASPGSPSSAASPSSPGAPGLHDDQAHPGAGGDAAAPER
jgi:hypothetical protein